MTSADPAGPATAGPAGFPDVAAAEHWIAALEPAPELAATHLVREPHPHVVVTLDATDGGRAVRFPGADGLTGTLTVGEVLARSAIARVEVLGGGPADPATPLDTGDFVRPLWRAGELVLVTTPAAGGRLVPFERRDPTPCCAAH